VNGTSLYVFVVSQAPVRDEAFLASWGLCDADPSSGVRSRSLLFDG
jgi:hypothetical protein